MSAKQVAKVQSFYHALPESVQVVLLCMAIVLCLLAIKPLLPGAGTNL